MGLCIGALETSMTPRQILMIWDFWREELAQASDEQFRDWVVGMGHAAHCESGKNLDLGLS